MKALQSIQQKKINAESMKTEVFYLCDCYSHGLLVEKDDETNSMLINCFERGFDGRKMSMFERLKWCFYIIKNGHPYTDMIVLNESKSLDLAKFIKQSFKS
jgi:hypothetical protein